MVWFRECWHEEVLRQLRQGLTKCYQVAFETRGDGKQSSYSVVNYDLIIRLEIGQLLGDAVMSCQKWDFSLSTSVPWSQKKLCVYLMKEGIFLLWLVFFFTQLQPPVSRLTHRVLWRSWSAHSGSDLSRPQVYQAHFHQLHQSPWLEGPRLRLKIQYSRGWKNSFLSILTSGNYC